MNKNTIVILLTIIGLVLLFNIAEARAACYQYVLTIGSIGSNEGNLYLPSGVALDTDGYVYVADTFNNRIQKFGMNGEFALKWGNNGGAPGFFNTPYGIDTM